MNKNRESHLHTFAGNRCHYMGDQCVELVRRIFILVPLAVAPYTDTERNIPATARPPLARLWNMDTMAVT